MITKKKKRKKDSATFYTEAARNLAIMDHHFRSPSIASKRRGANSGLGVFTAHFTPGTLMAAVSSIRKGTAFGPLQDRYKTSLLAFLRFATKKRFDAAKCSTVESTL